MNIGLKTRKYVGGNKFIIFILFICCYCFCLNFRSLQLYVKAVTYCNCKHGLKGKLVDDFLFYTIFVFRKRRKNEKEKQVMQKVLRVQMMKKAGLKRSGNSASFYARRKK